MAPGTVNEDFLINSFFKFLQSNFDIAQFSIFLDAILFFEKCFLSFIPLFSLNFYNFLFFFWVHYNFLLVSLFPFLQFCVNISIFSFSDFISNNFIDFFFLHAILSTFSFLLYFLSATFFFLIVVSHNLFLF